ncbi:MAG: hypothetical protein WBK77_01220 [Alphaproteobacteria bacterium]
MKWKPHIKGMLNIRVFFNVKAKLQEFAAKYELSLNFDKTTGVTSKETDFTVEGDDTNINGFKKSFRDFIDRSNASSSAPGAGL